MDELLPQDPTRDGAYSVRRPDGKREDMHWSHAAHAWFLANGSIIGPVDMGEHGYSDPRYVEADATEGVDADQLSPEDPSMDGLYWVRRPKGGWEVISWIAGSNFWMRDDGGAPISQYALARAGYSDPRYIPTPDETPATPTLDDLQAPAWTLSEPGWLHYCGGLYAVEWDRENETDERRFAALYMPPDQSLHPELIGYFATPEQAKAAAEQHAKWCKEFGL